MGERTIRSNLHGDRALAWAPLEVSARSAGGPARLGLFDDFSHHDEIAGLKRDSLSGR